MRVLLDECLPFDLMPLLAGHDVEPVARLGWAGTKNGVLLRRAAEDGFAAFLTIDKRLSHQQLIPVSLAVVALRARSNRMQDLEPLVPAILAAFTATAPGQIARVGAESLHAADEAASVCCVSLENLMAASQLMRGH